MSYTVTAPLVVLKLENGTRVHLYEGVPVPKDGDQDHVKQLLDAGMIGKAEEPTAPESDGTPAKSASKADWVAYATNEARGDDRLTAEEADAMTRDELAAKYKG